MVVGEVFFFSTKKFGGDGICFLNGVSVPQFDLRSDAQSSALFRLKGRKGAMKGTNPLYHFKLTSFKDSSSVYLPLGCVGTFCDCGAIWSEAAHFSCPYHRLEIAQATIHAAEGEGWKFSLRKSEGLHQLRPGN